MEPVANDSLPQGPNTLKVTAACRPLRALFLNVFGAPARGAIPPNKTYNIPSNSLFFQNFRVKWSSQSDWPTIPAAS
jgi:hypothetical protein